MESLKEIVARYVESGNAEMLETMKTEVGYVIEFSRRVCARTMAEHDRVKGNLEQALANERLIESALEKIKATS